MGACCSAEAKLIQQAADALAADIVNPNITKVPTSDWRRKDYEDALDMSEQGFIIGRALQQRDTSAKPLELDLFGLYVGDDAVLSISESLKMTQLCLPMINLSFNEVTDVGAQALASVLRPQFRVKRLLLRGNKIQLPALRELLTQCPTIEHFEIPFGDKSTVIRDTRDELKRFLEQIQSAESLTRVGLHLWGCGADSPGLVETVIACGRNRNIKALQIRGEERIVAKMDAISSAGMNFAAALKQLHSFELYDIELSNNTMAAVADSLGVYSHLQELVLMRCGVTGPALKKLADAFSRNRSLTRLDISHNSAVDNDALAVLFRAIEKHKKLKSLFLVGLQFSDATFEILLKAMEKSSAPLSTLRHSVTGGRETFHIRLNTLLERNSIDNDVTSSPSASDDDNDDKENTVPPQTSAYSPRSPVSKPQQESKGATFWPPPNQPAPQPEPSAKPVATATQVAPPAATFVNGTTPAPATAPPVAATAPPAVLPTTTPQTHVDPTSSNAPIEAPRKRIIASAFKTPMKAAASHSATEASTAVTPTPAPAPVTASDVVHPEGNTVISASPAPEPRPQTPPPATSTVDRPPPAVSPTPNAVAPGAQPARRFVASAFKTPAKATAGAAAVSSGHETPPPTQSTTTSVAPIATPPVATASSAATPAAAGEDEDDVR